MSETDLARMVTRADLEAAARLAIEPAAFDYLAGGAWDERAHVAPPTR